MQRHPFCFLSLFALMSFPLCSTAQQATATASVHTSCRIDTSSPNDADRAYSSGKLQEASTLYEKAFRTNAGDERSRELWIDSLIGQHKLAEASSKADEWTSSSPKSARAIVTAAEVREAEGDWLEAYALESKAMEIDPCIPDVYEDMGMFEMRAGYHATAKKHLALAHQLEPNNRSIRSAWMTSLPPAQYLEELKSDLQTNKSLTEERRKTLEHQLVTLNALTQNKCELASSKGPAVIPMTPVRKGFDVDYYALEVSINGHKRLLQIDTGASGFLLTRGAIGGTGLTRINTVRVGGFGDDGSNGATLGSAASIQISGLEFKNCAVMALDQTGALRVDTSGALAHFDAQDGLVGTDIFERYLVTLDYIKHEIRLDPLPPSTAEAGLPTDALGGINEPDILIEDRTVAPAMKSWTKIYRDGHMLIIPARVNKVPSRLFILDTGSFTNLIDTKLAAQVSTQHESSTGMKGLSGTVSQMSETGKFTVDFANIRLPVKSMDALDLSKENGLSGFLGYPTLEQLVMHIDYRDNLIQLEAPQARK